MALLLAVSLAGGCAPPASALIERRETVTLDGLPPVQLRVRLAPEYANRAERYVSAAERALQRFGDWYGPCPGAEITLVDAGSRGVLADPRDLVVRTHWIEPGSAGAIEAAVVDAISRRYWEPLPARDVPDAASWLDGLRAFSTAKALNDLYAGEHVEIRRYFGAHVPYVLRGVPTTHGGLRFGVRAARSAADRAAAAFATLERYIGWGALQAGLAQFAGRRRDPHGGRPDLFAILTETSGRNLKWFAEDALAAAKVFDYGIEALENTTSGTSASRSRTVVRARRYGDGIFPDINVLVTFPGGVEVREHWDGRESAVAFEYDSASPAIAAAIDPDAVLLLDANPRNNRRTIERGPRAAAVWTARWGVWLQDAVLTYSALF